MDGSDILDVFARLRHDFMRMGLEPPEAVILKSHADGMRFLCEVRQKVPMVYHAPHPHYKPVEHPDGSVWIEAQIMGVKVHWPANRYAVEAGGYVWG